MKKKNTIKAKNDSLRGVGKFGCQKEVGYFQH